MIAHEEQGTLFERPAQVEPEDRVERARRLNRERQTRWRRRHQFAVPTYDEVDWAPCGHARLAFSDGKNGRRRAPARVRPVARRAELTRPAVAALSAEQRELTAEALAEAMYQEIQGVAAATGTTPSGNTRDTGPESEALEEKH